MISFHLDANVSQIILPRELASCQQGLLQLGKSIVLNRTLIQIDHLQRLGCIVLRLNQSCNSLGSSITQIVAFEAQRQQAQHLLPNS